MTDIGGLPGALGKLWPTWQASTRRRAAADRKLALYREAHLHLVNAKIDECLGGGQVCNDIRRFAHRSPNIFRAVCDAIAVAYRSGCRRELEGATPEVARAFADIVTETGITRRAAGINAASWAAGPHFVAPYITDRNRVAIDILPPNRTDAAFRGDEVVRVVWQVGRDGAYVLLDAERWSYFDGNGNPANETRTHTVERCPAVPFVCYDGGPDFWAATAHDGLADATLICAMKQATGLYMRQVSGKPQLVLSGPPENVPRGQVLGHPVQPLIPGDGVTATVLDTVVRAEDYLAEISAIITMAISAEGLPPGSVTMQANNSDWGNLAISTEGPRLAVHRDRQVPFLDHCERELWPIVVDMVRGSEHRHRKVIPPGDEIRDMLLIDFPDLATPKEQLERIEVMRAGLPFGLTSPVDVPLQARPEVTRAQVVARQKQNLADYVATIEPLVTRNIPAEAPAANGHQTAAQQQGRVGGQISGQQRADAAQGNP